MEFQIALFVVGLLEEDVGPDPGFFKKAVIVNSRCRDVDVDTADGAVFVLDTVDGLNGFQIVVHRISHRILTGFQCETLVSHVLKCDDFSADILLRELFPWNVFVFCVVRTVGTAVDAVVGQIKRCKHHDAVSVEIFLDLFCQFVDLLIFFLDGTGKKYGCFPVGEPFSFLRLFDD